nr:DUF4037 domain-containing protein [Oscillospiraceae bacterium]
LFALNGVTHPGEKRLVQLAKEMCPVLPVGFEDDISAVFCHMFTDAEALADDLERILGALKDIL